MGQECSALSFSNPSEGTLASEAICSLGVNATLVQKTHYNFHNKGTYSQLKPIHTLVHYVCKSNLNFMSDTQVTQLLAGIAQSV